MAISVVHHTPSLIADDPASATAGKIVPSNWNENHDITLAADRILGRTTGAGAVEEIPCGPAGRALIDDTDAAAMRTTLGVAIGTNVQAYDADLAAIAALTSAANKLAYATGSGAWSLTDLSVYARTLLAAVDAAAALLVLGAAPLASPIFTGSPKVPTKAPGDNSTNAASTAYADAAAAVNVPPAVASQAQMEAAASNAVFASPGRLQNHPGVAKAWGKINKSGTSSGTLLASYNISSMAIVGNTITVNLDTDMSSADYAIVIFGTSIVAPTSQLAGSFVFSTTSNTDLFFAVYGDQ